MSTRIGDKNHFEASKSPREDTRLCRPRRAVARLQKNYHGVETPSPQMPFHFKFWSAEILFGDKHE